MDTSTNHASNLWTSLCIAAEQRPQHPAIIQGKELVTYISLHQRALDYAAWLLEQQIKPRDRVVLWLDSSAEMAAALFGTWAAGGIPVLISTASRVPQLRHAIDKCQPGFIFFSSATPLPFEVENATAVEVGQVGTSSRHPQLPGHPMGCDPASIVFTSGSTGRPKGVVQSHGNLAHGATTVAGYLQIGAEDRILCPIPWAFDYGYLQLQTTIKAGATQILPERMDPFGICSTIAEQRPTVFPGVPSLFGYLLQEISPFKQTDLSSIRVVTNTGGTIPGPFLDELLILFRHSRFFLNYGLTESYRTSYLDPAMIEKRRDSIGKAVPGVEIVIVRDDGSIAGPNETGEIVHRGNFIFLEYWNDPEATARSLQPDPVDTVSGKKALFTGDYGSIDEDGFLYYSGRKDHQLKVMGVRVSPGEIEELIYDSGLSREVAVFGIDHDILGHEVCAAVVPHDMDDDTEKKLKVYARGTMTQNMMPRRWIMLDRIPRTTTGKSDYPALRKLVSDN